MRSAIGIQDARDAFYASWPSVIPTSPAGCSRSSRHRSWWAWSSLIRWGQADFFFGGIWATSILTSSVCIGWWGASLEFLLGSTQALCAEYSGWSQCAMRSAIGIQDARDAFYASW